MHNPFSLIFKVIFILFLICVVVLFWTYMVPKWHKNELDNRKPKERTFRSIWRFITYPIVAIFDTCFGGSGGKEMCEQKQQS